VPEGWIEKEPGQFGRGASETDPTFLVQIGVPGATVELVTQLLLPKISLESLPPSAGRFENARLGWDLYAVERQDPDAGLMRTDLAFAQGETGAYVVLFGTTPDEYDELHYSVFLRAIDAFTPLSAEEGGPRKKRAHETTGDVRAEVLLLVGENLENEASERVADLLQSKLGLRTAFVGLDALERVDFQDVKLIYLPGGEAASIRPSEAALRRVRQAVAAGTGYVGTCAGAFLAAEATTTAPHVRLGKESYAFGIFPGLAEWGGGEGTWPFYLDLRHPLVARSSYADEIAPVMRMRFVGGTSNLLPSHAAALGPWRVATLDPPTGEGATGNRAAMTATVFGKGRVFLSGPHPEAQEETYPLLLAAAEWCAGLSDAADGPPPRVVAEIPAEGIVGRFLPCSAAGSRDPQGYPIGYTWDFGDGSPRQHRPEAIHIYETPGDYTITLTVSTGTRNGAIAKTVSICTPQQA
jgi:putative intracellular protease/amidase